MFSGKAGGDELYQQRIIDEKAIFDGVIDENNDNSNEDGGVTKQKKEGKRTFLSKSLHGSPRHLKDRARNGLHLVSHYEGSDFFLTLTCNIRWPEIVSALQAGQSAFDSPEIVCQVFHNRLQNFLKNLRHVHYFDHY